LLDNNNQQYRLQTHNPSIQKKQANKTGMREKEAKRKSTVNSGRNYGKTQA
jgi:hypothetical protein